MIKTKKRVIPALLFLGSLIGAIAISPCLARANAQSRPELLQNLTQLSTMEQAREWATYYYLHPRPDLLPSALDVFAKAGVLKSMESEGSLIAFMAQVCAASPSPQLSSWVSAVAKSPENQRVAFESALWIANTVESRLALTQLGHTETGDQKKAVNNMLARTPPDLLQGEIASPAVVDALWWSFYASGDARFVERIISVLPMSKSEDAQQASIGRAAQSSLASNVIQHPKVMQICESSSWRLPSTERAMLTQIIERAKEGQH